MNLTPLQIVVNGHFVHAKNIVGEVQNFHFTQKSKFLRLQILREFRTWEGHSIEAKSELWKQGFWGKTTWKMLCRSIRLDMVAISLVKPVLSIAPGLNLPNTQDIRPSMACIGYATNDPTFRIRHCWGILTIVASCLAARQWKTTRSRFSSVCALMTSETRIEEWDVRERFHKSLGIPPKSVDKICFVKKMSGYNHRQNTEWVFMVYCHWNAWRLFYSHWSLSWWPIWFTRLCASLLCTPLSQLRIHTLSLSVSSESKVLLTDT